MTQCYQPIALYNLDIIQEKALQLIREDEQKHTHLFYLDNNIEQFLSIPELKSELTRLGMIHWIYSFALLIVKPLEKTPIHQDTGPITYSFNIPIQGCENTQIKWFQSNAKPEEHCTAQKKNYFVYNAPDCIEIDRFDMSTPAIINVKIPHEIVNLNTWQHKPRVTLLTRLKQEIGEIF